MKKLSIYLLSTVIVFGCASQPDYREAEKGGFGYSESQLSDTQYRVHFKARGSDKEKAMDYAMLRAAELTLLAGYDWFQVTDRETLVDKERVEKATSGGFSQRYTQSTECGLLTCRTTTQPTTTFSSGIFVGGSEKSEIESVLSIEMGSGKKPDGGTAFDAKAVRDNIKPEPSSS